MKIPPRVPLPRASNPQLVGPKRKRRRVPGWGSVGPPSSGGLQGRLGDGDMNHPLQIRNRSGTDFGVDGTSSPSLTSES